MVNNKFLKKSTYISSLNHKLKKNDIRYQIPQLERIILYVTSLCNAKCLMCDIGIGSGTGIDRFIQNDERNLDLKLLDKILLYLKKSGKKISFNILMTEPLLHPDIGVIVNKISSDGHVVRMTTNGQLLPKKYRELVDNGISSIQVSLDGPLDLHNKIRRIKNFDKAIEGIRLIKSANPQVGVSINCTITNLNYNRLSELAFTLGTSGVCIDVLKFQFMDFVSSDMANNQKLCEPELLQSESIISDDVSPEKIDVKILHHELVKIKKMKFDNITSIKVIPDIIDENKLGSYFSLEGKEMEYYNFCTLPYKQIAIKTDGSVIYHMRCFDIDLGNVNNTSVMDIFNGHKAKEFRDKLNNSNFCMPACTRCCGVNFR